MTRVLLSAYTCEPHRGSEPEVGWNMADQLSRFFEVWVLTRAEHQGPIEEELARNPRPNLHFIYYETPYWMRFYRKRGSPRGLRLHYYLWQIMAYFHARSLNLDFDVVHHITYVKYYNPSFVSSLPQPFIWGPVGGGETTPPAFYSALSSKGQLIERLRDVGRAMGHNDPFVRMTAKQASIAFATTPETAHHIGRLGVKRVEVLPAIAMSDVDFELLSGLPVRKDGPFRILSMGRLLDWKGFHMGLQAFAKITDDHPDAEMWIVGDGQQRAELEATAAVLGVADRVTFFGNLPREDALQKIAACDVLVHPSLHDSGAGVVMEAMAAARPVVCLALGGPAVQVTAETGYAIEATTPTDVIEKMALALGDLADDPVRRRRMGAAAQARIREVFSWNAKGDILADYYKQVLS